ncbi:uncharacterized protein LOC124177977 [Neodiprion fabricii]|uniref:uncharacterized protein LOC124177977 n=1 Tax=Neodiprion fabricii TaxID=2872261 RepID=UPI001ED916EE|nr:uncharacterized protein LOC124177977 [Neodiprion fabricii]
MSVSRTTNKLFSGRHNFILHSWYQNFHKVRSCLEPVASGSVIWIPRKTEKFRENNEPVVYYCRAVGPETTDKRDVKKRWIPVRPDVVSPKYIRPNECHLHQSHLNSQSAVTTTLTCMLPHRGRVVKRKDIRWDVGSHKTSVEMTDELETHWGRPACCSTQWAEAFTASTGCPPY